MKVRTTPIRCEFSGEQDCYNGSCKRGLCLEAIAQYRNPEATAIDLILKAVAAGYTLDQIMAITQED